MKRPFLQFYVNDHRADIALKMCPAAARGIWMDMLCIMADGEPYGHLRVSPSGTPFPTSAGIPVGTSAGIPVGTSAGIPVGTSRRTARGTSAKLPANGSLEPILQHLIHDPADVIKEALEMLEHYGVFSRVASGDLKGVIFSRRMVRDEEKNTKRAQAMEYERLRKRKGRDDKPAARPTKGSLPEPPPDVSAGSPNRNSAGSPNRNSAGSPNRNSGPIRIRTRTRELNPSPTPPATREGLTGKSKSGYDRDRAHKLAAAATAAGKKDA